ncbi:MAG: VWA domain-containing protein, partial [Anaerolineae bacterium]|nr:VWA domain-containing protein [Anaerolineae bacterium]
MIEPNHRGLLRGCLALALLAAVLLVAFPTAAQSPDPVTLDIATSPDTSTLRQTEVEVKLTLQGNASVCPPITTQRSLDAVLLLDNSASMTGPSIDSAKAAAQLFVDSMSLDVPTNAGGDRVALITFSDQAVGLSDLTQDRNALQQLIQSIGPQSGTNIAAGIEAATIALTHNGKPANNPAQVIVLLSDGEDPDHPVAEAANQAKAKGVRIVTIRLGDRPIGDILRTIASVPTDYYEAPKPSDLADIYRRIADVIQPTTAAQNVNLNFRYDDYRFQLIPDSIKPAPTSVQGNVIHWDYPAIENVDAAVFSFRVVPLHTGDPVNVGEVVQSSYGYCEDTVARRPLS